MANEFTGTNIEALKSHLSYWMYELTGLDGMWAGDEIPTSENYFMFEFISLDKIVRPFQQPYDDNYITVGFHAEIVIRLNIYGDTCYSNILKVQNSLFGDKWPSYLNDSASVAIANTSNIRYSSEFNFTEFLKQAQFDITFNTFIYENEEIEYIETVNIEYNFKDVSNETIFTEDIEVTYE